MSRYSKTADFCYSQLTTKYVSVYLRLTCSNIQVVMTFSFCTFLGYNKLFCLLCDTNKKIIITAWIHICYSTLL